MKAAIGCVLLLLLLSLSMIAPAFAHGELLVGNKSDDTVWRLSLADGRKLGEIATGPGPHEIAVAPDGRTAVVTNYGHARPGHSLTALELGSGAARRTIELGAHARPHGVRFLPDGQRVLVTTEQSGSLLLVGIGSGKVERVFDVGDGVGHMVAVSRDGRIAYVSKLESGRLVRVDLASAEVLEKPAGAGAEGIEVAADGSVWVSNRADDSVTVHDPRTLAILHTLRSEGFPIRVVFTADDRHALVTNARAGTLAVFDARTRKRVATVALADPDREYRDTMLGRAALPIGVIADPVQPRVYVAISGGDEIAVVDTGTWQVLERWRTGRQPDALGLVPGASAGD